MPRVLVLALAVAGGQGWWGNNGSSLPPEGPWQQWARTKAPTAMGYYDRIHDSATQLREQVEEWSEWSPHHGWDFSIWTAFDGIISLVGWVLFGAAWGNVKTGCRRIVQLGILVILCIVAHYVWAICWPVVSLLVAIVMTVVWVVRKAVKLAGKLVFHTQRLMGGTPEAVDAEYFGPGTGNVPETSELRKFKFSSTQDKWVVLKRGSQVVVFKLANENQTIRSSGLYVSVEPDSARGSPELMDELKGFDKVHLCRNDSCAEDGQHFKVYGLAKKYDPEKFELALAAQGAQQAGQALWAWAWSGTKKVAASAADFGSESEKEETKCCGHRVRWSTEAGDAVLSAGPCVKPGSESVPLLVEDQYGVDDHVQLCPTHASKYLTQRYVKKCSYQDCKRVGRVSNEGMCVCVGTMSPRRAADESGPDPGNGEDAVNHHLRQKETTITKELNMNLLVERRSSSSWRRFAT